MHRLEPTVVVVAPVPDSPATTALESVIREQGLHVYVTTHGDEASVGRITPHAVLVYTLPSVVAAMQSIRVVRNTNLTVPIIALGHRESVREIEYLFQAGASDYAPPPHATHQFAASLRAVERLPVEPAHLLVQPGLTLDEIGMTATVQGRAIALTAIECAILARLLRAPGAIVSSETLLNDAWPRGVPATLQALRTHVRDLRKKIERNASHPRCILSVRGRGYTFNPEP